MSYKVAVLPGDGIGPEVIDEAVKTLKACGLKFEFEDGLLGGTAYDETGSPLPSATVDLCKDSDATLMGAVGGPKWDKIEPVSLRPEIGGLLALRQHLGLYANIRPAKTLRPLVHASPLKEGRNLMDLVVVRELTGGIYFGEPRFRDQDGNRAVDSCVYHRFEIERISKIAFDIARARSKQVTSVDKANVLETSRLWREVVEEMAQKNTDVSVQHMLVDNCAMQLVRDPGQFDVILTDNMFGDILSDEASMITGSLGLLPSASLGEAKGDKTYGLYEPVHGSAPDIAGQGKANPLAAILSAAMMLRFSLNEGDAADRIESAVESALNEGLRTADIFEANTKLVSTSEMGDAVVAKMV